MKTGFFNGILILISVGAALLLGEIVLRAFGTDNYYVYPPNLMRTFKPLPGVMPGITGESRFAINESGMRGDPYPEDGRHGILAIGGSTTICTYLDQSEAWPQLLQDKLNNVGESDVWVGNVGRSGHNTRHHLFQVEKLLEQYPRTELIVLLIGANDLSMRLKNDVNFRPMSEEGQLYSEKLMYQSFSVYPVKETALPFYYKNTEIWRLLRQAKREIASRFGESRVEDNAGIVYEERRRRRANPAKILNSLPDITSALDEYAQNIHRIIDLAEERGIRIVFMTQPAMWRLDLPESLSDLLWLGGIGDYQNVSNKPYYSAGALADALEMYNETLLNVCSARSVDCLDLAPLVPKDATAFFDDVHFNEQGARIVADAVAQYLLENNIVD